MKTLWKSNLWFWLVLLAIVFGLPAVFDRSLVHGAPPPMEAYDLDGIPFAWSDMAGQPVVLYFWATWCPICRAMQGSIGSVAKDHAVITVALQSGNDAELRSYLRKEGLPLRVISDPEGSLVERYGLRGVPALFFVNRQGRIRFVATGYTSEIGIRLRIWWMDRMT